MCVCMHVLGCFDTTAVLMRVRVCRCPLGDAVYSVPFCAAFSILAPSVSRNTSRHSIHQIDSEGAEITRVAVQAFVCANGVYL